jgi:alpha-L-arabinofuranosidase
MRRSIRSAIPQGWSRLRQRKAVWLGLVFVVTGLLTRATAGEDVTATTIHVNAGKTLNRITPWMTGSCIEDVNHEIYGGLYAQKLFGESFEEPPLSPKFEGWTVLGGNWRLDGQIVSVDAMAGAKLVRNGPEFTDGVVDADVRLTERGDNAGLIVRARNAGVGIDNFDGYEVSIRSAGRQVLLGRHQHDWRLLSAVPATIAPDQWHHLRVVLEGARIRVYVDRETEPKIDFTDRPNPMLSGGVALRTWNSDASFRAVRIQTGSSVVENTFQSAPRLSVSGMWDPIATAGTPAAHFTHETTGAFNGRACQKIVHGAETGIVGVANRGLNRWGIAVKRGEKLEGRIYLRTDDLTAPVTVALQSADGAATYATQQIRGVTGQWAKYRFRLTARTTDKRARFAVWIDQPGALWLDQAVLMGTGSARFQGLPIRADIAHGLVDEGVTFLRYAGTMVNVPEYRWKNMIGDPDKRPPYAGNWYPYATNGFGIFDFLNFCEAARIESAFAINIEETPQDAADLVDYLTAPVTNPWGAKRAADGHLAPYHTRYIEIGNEEAIGTETPAAYAHYAERFRLLARAMRARNPKLQLVCAGWWLPNSPHMRTVFDAVDGEAAAWDLHVDSDGARAGTVVDRQLTQMQALFQQWNPHTTLKAVIFEENGNLHNMQRALGHATTLNAARRHGDFVLADCPANCLQPWLQNDNGWDQGQLFFTPDHVWAMPPYYAQQMASQTYLPLRVESRVEGSADLDVTATMSADGKTLCLSVANVGNSPQTAALQLKGFGASNTVGTFWTLAADPQAVNPPEGQETVRPTQGRLAPGGGAILYRFLPYSYTVLQWKRAPAK